MDTVLFNHSIHKKGITDFNKGTNIVCYKNNNSRGMI